MDSSLITVATKLFDSSRRNPVDLGSAPCPSFELEILFSVVNVRSLAALTKTQK